MRGDLFDRWGRRHAADFEIKAEASSLPRFARAGRARITGVVDAAPWADHAPLQGEIEISLLRRRRIDYRFEFDNDREEHFQLSGHKDLSLLRPIDSFTRMQATLRRETDVVARGELFFDVNHVLAFFGSWWPSSSIGRVRMRRPLSDPAAGPALSESEQAIADALARAALAPGRLVPDVDERTLKEANEQLLWAPDAVVTGFKAGLRWLDTAALLRTGKRFVQLNRAEASAFLESLAAGEPAALLTKLAGPLGRGAWPVDLLLQLMTTPCRSAHFQRPEYLRALGHPTRIEVSAEKPPRHFARVKEPETLESVTEVYAEVAIVGTGAGGAPLAAALAEKGIAVAILEEGRFKRRHDFAGSPAERMRALFRYSGMNFAIGTPLALPLGRLVGGTTAINSGTCFVTPDTVLDEWRRDLGFPADFEPERYHRYSQRVSDALQVEPGTPAAVGRIGDVIGRGADALGLRHGPLPRNAPGCPGRGECVLGCPEGAKRSTDISFIPSALKAGAELYVGLPMTRILKRGRRIVAMEARGSDKHGRPIVVRVFAERFVLACGSLLTPVVLSSNDLGGPRVGKNLSVHPAAGIVARCPEPLGAWDAIPQGYAVHGYEDEGIQFEGYYMAPQMLAPSLPFVGSELTRWMDDFDRLGQFGFMVRDRGDGWVRRGPNGRPVIGYRLTQESQAKLRKAASIVARIFIEAGASEVVPCMARQPLVRTRAQADALANVPTRAMDFRLLGAHPLGTCAMGTSPERAVVDFDHRVFGTDNLHIVDGSAVPTSLGVNPQMTIMAMALRAADVIADRLASSRPAAF